METDCYISLGSNLGDRELNLLRAVAETGRLAGCRVTSLSPFYETSPVGLAGQPLFCNAVMKLSTLLLPHELLERLQHIEIASFKRRRTVPNGPRRMDIDILLFGDRIIEDDKLTVPHPRMHERRFVLHPLCDIAPDILHPVFKKSIAELLAELHSDEIVVKI